MKLFCRHEYVDSTFTGFSGYDYRDVTITYEHKIFICTKCKKQNWKKVALND